MSTLSCDALTADFMRLIPRDYARDHCLVSQGLTNDGHELLCVGFDTDQIIAWNVGVRLGRRVHIQVADREEIVRTLDQAFERLAAVPQEDGDESALDAQRFLQADSQTDIDQLLADAERDLLRTSGKAPMVQLVDALLFRAVQLGASDVHVQPLIDKVVVRHRVDGVLDDGRELALSLLRPMVSRIKVMGRMDVAERLIPQDGRAGVNIGERTIDLRISTMPTPHGERVVIRLLDAGSQLHEFATLGMPQEIAQPFLSAARRSNGIVLVTGPTGSGKTTTLYATLRELNSAERNIMTIEDPIEYDLDSLGLPISQSQVNQRKGVTFANGLRHILRQDPDIIMVGEIRDAETARTAIQSSLTGHLVFSTLHTNDAVSAVSRLIDLGVEPYLVAASLSAVLAQRLVRKCNPAHQEAAASSDHQQPYKGRCGIFELLLISDALRALIARGASLDQLRDQAQQEGHKTLLQQGEQLVAQGVTTAVEVERVVHG